MRQRALRVVDDQNRADSVDQIGKILAEIEVRRFMRILGHESARCCCNVDCRFYGPLPTMSKAASAGPRSRCSKSIIIAFTTVAYASMIPRSTRWEERHGLRLLHPERQSLREQPAHGKPVRRRHHRGGALRRQA